MKYAALVALVLQATPPEGLIMAMALSYGLSLLGMLLAWRNYRKRKAGKGPRSGGGGGSSREKSE
ncbi:MAG: hypothetical protein ACRD6I_02715 [Candidatus Acidiferrales bacterium]